MSPASTPASQKAPGFAAALERKLDEWSLGIRAETEPGEFLRGWLTLTVHTARADVAIVWLKTADDRWSRIELTLESPEGRPAHEIVDQPPDDVARALTGNLPVNLRGQLSGATIVRGLCPVRQGGTPVGVLEAIWLAEFHESSRDTLQPFLRASGELLGDFLGRHELHHLRNERHLARRWERYQESALAQPSLRSLAQQIAHDGRPLTGSERLSVVHCQDGHCAVLAVSGVDVIDPRSSTVHALEHLARQCAGIPKLTPSSELPLNDPLLRSGLDRLRQTTNAQRVEVQPLIGTTEELWGIIVGEVFDETPLDDWSARLQRLRRNTTAPWVALCLADRKWWTSGWRQLVRAGQQHRARALGLLAAGFALVVVLGLLPSRLVITAEGMIHPDQRRDVFAGTSGIVTDVLVGHGDVVSPGAELATLRDPSADLEATRISGDLATVQARLNVIQAARIGSTGTGGNATAESQQLAGEEAELKHRRDSLLAQQKLLADERQATRITSPIAGSVLTWDVQALLTGRPVQRGQILMTIGDVEGPWIVEAHVRERDLPELIRGHAENSEGLSASFVPVAALGRSYRAQVVDIARVTDVNERGETTVRVILAFDRDPADPLRPGATVLPRIDCGSRSLGYVWLREPWHAIRQQWWLWW